MTESFLPLRRFSPTGALALFFAVAGLSPAPVHGAEGYRIRGDELLEIVVYQEADLSSTYRVAGDGAVNMPLIGRVNLRGTSPAAAAEVVRQRLRDGYLVNPQVTVRVLKFAELRFTVLGQVRQPGALTVGADQRLTLLQAIGLAGGYTRLANPRKVTVKRTDGERVTVQSIDARALAAGSGGAAFDVRDGDVITVAESRF